MTSAVTFLSTAVLVTTLSQLPDDSTTEIEDNEQRYLDLLRRAVMRCETNGLSQCQALLNLGRRFADQANVTFDEPLAIVILQDTAKKDLNRLVDAATKTISEGQRFWGPTGEEPLKDLIDEAKKLGVKVDEAGISKRMRVAYRQGYEAAVMEAENFALDGIDHKIQGALNITKDFANQGEIDFNEEEVRARLKMAQNIGDERAYYSVLGFIAKGINNIDLVDQELKRAQRWASNNNLPPIDETMTKLAYAEGAKHLLILARSFPIVHGGPTSFLASARIFSERGSIPFDEEEASQLLEEWQQSCGQYRSRYCS